MSSPGRWFDPPNVCKRFRLGVVALAHHQSFAASHSGLISMLRIASKQPHPKKRTPVAVAGEGESRMDR